MKHSLELTQPSDLAGVLDTLESTVLKATNRKELAGELRLITEEALTNILKYAYPAREEGHAKVLLAIDPETVHLEIRDEGLPFDPLEQPPPDLETPVEERQEGGLGIYLLKSLADEVAYTRDRDTNVLRITKRRV